MQVLLNQHTALLDQLDTVTDPQLAQAIVAEGHEILHRVNLTQNLLFVSDSEELKKAVVAVRAADLELKAELENIADVAKFIDGVADWLGYVDKAIDLAKKVALI